MRGRRAQLIKGADHGGAEVAYSWILEESLCQQVAIPIKRRVTDEGEPGPKRMDEDQCRQMRKSGEPFFVHPVQVAKLLTGLKMDSETVMAGLLHDTVEDTDTTLNHHQYSQDVYYYLPLYVI